MEDSKNKSNGSYLLNTLRAFGAPIPRNISEIKSFPFSTFAEIKEQYHQDEVKLSLLAKEKCHTSINHYQNIQDSKTNNLLTLTQITIIILVLVSTLFYSPYSLGLLLALVPLSVLKQKSYREMIFRNVFNNEQDFIYFYCTNIVGFSYKGNLYSFKNDKKHDNSFGKNNLIISNIIMEKSPSELKAMYDKYIDKSVNIRLFHAMIFNHFSILNIDQNSKDFVTKFTLFYFVSIIILTDKSNKEAAQIYSLWFQRNLDDIKESTLGNNTSDSITNQLLVIEQILRKDVESSIAGEKIDFVSSLTFVIESLNLDLKVDNEFISKLAKIFEANMIIFSRTHNKVS